MPTRLTLTELENLNARQRHVLKCERLLGFLNDAILPYAYVWQHPLLGEIGVRVEAVGLQDGDLVIRAEAGLTASGIPLLVASPLRFVNPPVRVQTGTNAAGMAIYAFRPLEAICQALAHTVSLMPLNPDRTPVAPADPTLTAYPDADPETSTVDGRVRHAGTNVTWATVYGGAGTSSNDVTTGGTSNSVGELEAGTTTDRWTQMERGIFLFDTSSIPADATVSSQTLSLYGISKDTGLGTSVDLDVVSSAPASNTALVAGDYDSLGASVYGSVAHGSFLTSAYNDIALSGGLTLAGITKLGTRLSWDTDNSPPTWVSAAKTSFRAYYADQTGTTNDPKLVVVYTAGRRRVMIAT